MIKTSIAAICLSALWSQAAPYLPEELQLRVVINLGSDLGGGNSVFNSRIFDQNNFVNQINSPMGFGRYPSGASTPSLVVNNTALPLEHRMVAPFRGSLRDTYLLASSSGATLSTFFSRYDFDGNNRVDANTPDNQTAEGFDWVNENTIIYSDYTSGNRRRLYLASVVAEPFSVNATTTWNANGYITSAVTTRIRNVRVGDVYSGFAYYGDSGQNNNPNFYAVNLATGAETLLGNAGTLTGGGSFGIWTVVERGGFLYVQTTDNGIQVYNMNSATSLGSLFATYSKELLDSVTGSSGQYFGLDVTPDGSKLLLSGLFGRIFEIGRPVLSVTQSGPDILLSWPASVTAVALQQSDSLSPANFSDLDPQPAISLSEDGSLNTATLPNAGEARFFRLRKL